MDGTRLLAFVLLCTLAFPSQATEQIPDKILVDGQEYVLLSKSPFDVLLGRPDMGTALKDSVNQTGPKCTANWRGYVATWEIKEKRLLLRSLNLNGCGEQPKLLPLSTFFLNQDSPVDTVWLSGILLLGKGTTKLVRDEPHYKSDIDRHYKYRRTVRYESYLKIEVSNGYVLAREDYEPISDQVEAPITDNQFVLKPEFACAIELGHYKYELEIVSKERDALVESQSKGCQPVTK